MKLTKKKTNANIPSDSMADIAFLLIIFFMLTTTFSVNKGFDFGIPPIEQSSTDSESRPALTVIVDSLGHSYRAIVVDEQGQQQEFRKNNIVGQLGNPATGGLVNFMDKVFEDVKVSQPENWYKLPIYILVRESAPFEGFVDVWDEVQKLEKKWKKEIPGIDENGMPIKEEARKLATHIPHVAQVEEIIARYMAEGKILL